MGGDTVLGEQAIGDGGFLYDLGRMVLHIDDTTDGHRRHLIGDAAEGFRLLEDRIEGPGLTRATYDLEFAADQSAVNQSLVVDLDANAIDPDPSGLATSHRVVLAAFPASWETPTVYDSSGRLLSTYVRSELSPDLGAAAVELMSLAVPAPPELDLRELTDCAARVVDGDAFNLEMTRGLADISTEQLAEVISGERPSGRRTQRTIAWIDSVARRLIDLAEAGRVAPLLSDIRMATMLVIPLAEVHGRQRIRVQLARRCCLMPRAAGGPALEHGWPNGSVTSIRREMS